MDARMMAADAAMGRLSGPPKRRLSSSAVRMMAHLVRARVGLGVGVRVGVGVGVGPGWG